MRTVNLADAKAKLSELVAEAAAGETVRILRRGKPVAQLTAVTPPRKRIDIEALRNLAASLPSQADTAGEHIRKMRDEDRY